MEDENKIKSVETSLDLLDHGDDVLRRFRYQICYSAVLSIGLLDENSEAEKIFCEHFEDILVKRHDGKFIGVQVKTQEINLGILDTSNEKIKQSIRRFINLEKEYGHQFLRYVFVTNNSVYNKDKTVRNLYYLIELAKDYNKDMLLKSRSRQKTLINQFISETDSDIDIIIKTFSKIHIEPEKISINHIELLLEDKLKKITSLKEQTPSTFEHIKNLLISKHFKAASLSMETELSEQFLNSSNPAESEVVKIILQKTFDRKQIQSYIENSITDPLVIETPNNDNINQLSKKHDLITKKMDAGGIPLESVDLFKDAKYAVLHRFFSMQYRDGHEKTQKIYNQVNLVVRNECLSSYDEHYTENEKFGTKMLKDIRIKLKERLNREKSIFFGLKHEHLLGMVGIITQECKLWWSKKFNLE